MHLRPTSLIVGERKKNAFPFHLPQLLETLVERLAETLGTMTCGILLWENTTEEFRLAAAVGLESSKPGGQGTTLRFSRDHPLVRTTAQYRGVLLREELVRRRPEAEFQAIAQAMDQLHAELVLPLYTEGQMRGVLALGPKSSGGMYHQRDLELLERLVKDAERILSYTVVLAQALTIMKLAHDARQPIAVMDSQVDALRTNRFGPTTAGQQVVLQSLEANLRFLNEFFTDLMELHRLVAHRLESGGKFGPVDLGQLLRRVTDNLRGNALKFTTQGWVRVKVQPKREWLEVQVQDTGSGIPQAVLPHIFEPFMQTAEGQKVVDGMGLGLAVVKEVVTLHGGQIWVESRVGEGTTFIVRLPTVDSGFAAAHQRQIKIG